MKKCGNCGAVIPPERQKRIVDFLMEWLRRNMV